MDGLWSMWTVHRGSSERSMAVQLDGLNDRKWTISNDGLNDFNWSVSESGQPWIRKWTLWKFENWTVLKIESRESKRQHFDNLISYDRRLFTCKTVHF